MGPLPYMPKNTLSYSTCLLEKVSYREFDCVYYRFAFKLHVQKSIVDFEIQPRLGVHCFLTVLEFIQRRTQP